MLEGNNRFDRLIYEDWFGLFPYSQRIQLQKKAEVKTYKAGEPIFVKNEPGLWLGVIMSGMVRICLRTPDKKEMLISMVERSEIFGERAVFDGQPRSGDAIAEKDTTCLLYYGKDLVPALYQAPEALMYVTKIMCNRVVRYMNTMELYALHQMPARLANFLLFTGEKYGVKTEKGISLRINLSQTDLSKQIASSRESINRQLKLFANQDLINIDDGEITITDIEGLKEIC